MEYHLKNLKENPIIEIKFTEGKDLNYVYRAATEATYKPYLVFWKQEDDPAYEEGWGPLNCYWLRYSEEHLKEHDSMFIHTDKDGNKSVYSKHILCIKFKYSGSRELRFTDFDEAWELFDCLKTAVNEREDTVEFEL